MTQTSSHSETGKKPHVTPVKVVRNAPPNVIFQRLVRQFELCVGQATNLNELLTGLSRVICDQTECLAVWVSQIDEEGQFTKLHPLTDENANTLWPTVSTVGNQLISHARTSRQICSTPLPTNATTQLVATPVNTNGDPESEIKMILLGCFSAKSQTALRLQWLMGMTAQAITNWFQSHLIVQSQLKQRGLTDSLGIVKSLDETLTSNQAAMVIVNQLRRICDAQQVALTIGGRLAAISDVEQVDFNSESNRIIQLACVQAEEKRGVLTMVAEEQSASSNALLQSYCRNSQVETCVNIPLITESEKVVGGLLIGGAAQRLDDANNLEYIQHLATLISGHLDIVLRANRSITSMIKTKLKDCVSHKWRKYFGFAVLLLTFVLCMPLPYRVACDCELQPVLRRFVAAPYDGILEHSLVENGDIVTKDQLLAQMDGRSLRIELSGLQAELAGANKRRDSALAQGDIAQSQIARSEMERYQSKIDLLDDRTRNLDVRSPIDGIVVSGDLEKVQGAPLEMGQTLYEIAPLEQMVSEIGIPESEIQYVQPGMEVSIKLSSFPFQTWHGTIKRIHPRAEILNDESVFIAEVIMPDVGIELRPGMKGSAKVTSIRAPLGWNLFHRSWEAVRYWTVW